MTTGQRLADVTALDEHQRELLASMRTDPNGTPLNLFRVLIAHPLLLDRVSALGRVFLREGLLPERERELVILRVAWRVRSRYEFAQHVRIGAEAGVTEADRDRIADESLQGWSPRETAMLRLADELLATDTARDSSWDAAVAAGLGPEQLLELVFMVGYYRMLAGFLRSVAVPVEGSVGLPPQAAGPDWG